ncbi:MAG: hypothetical protein JRE23_05110 [Deltaproteobacteria bacterium]|nr:hypothetical protein [Deltaproteobacteria bacterium]
MMLDVDLVSIAGVVLIFAYAVKTACVRKRTPSLSDAITIFLSSTGILAGLKVCFIAAVDPIFQQTFDDERTFFFMGGIAVIWVSVDTLIKRFRTD